MKLLSSLRAAINPASLAMHDVEQERSLGTRCPHRAGRCCEDEIPRGEGTPPPRWVGPHVAVDGRKKAQELPVRPTENFRAPIGAVRASFALRFFAGLLAVTVFGAAVVRSEAELIRQAIDSQQTLEARREACRSLQIHGGAAAAEALGPLLADPQLHYLARAALTAIPDPAATRILLAALARATEPAFAIGLLHSLGERRDAVAVPAIAGKLSDGDAQVRGAAMRALGQFGTAEAWRILGQWKAADEDRSTWEDAMILAAAECAGVAPPEAVSVFRRMQRSGRLSTRSAALMGLGRLGALTPDEWRSALKSPERLRREAAVALAATGTGGAFVPTASLMGELSAEVQWQLVVVLAARGAPAALPAIRRALQADEPKVRAAAARALGELGDTASADALFALAFSADEPGAGARAGLTRLPGRGTDEKLMQRFAQSEGQQRAWAIETLTARGYTPLVAGLFDARLLETPVMLRATTEALRTLAGGEDFGALLAFTLRISPDHRGALAAVLGHIARRADNAGEILRTCDQELRAAEPATAAVMLQLYTVVQTPEAATALSSWLRHEAKAVRTAAVQALGRWESGGSVEVLLEAAETHSDRELRSAALRAVAGVLRRRNAFRDQAPVLAWLRRALTAAESVDDKKALLTAVAQDRSATARKLVEQYFDDPKLGAEAKNLAERMR